MMSSMFIVYTVLNAWDVEADFTRDNIRNGNMLRITKLYNGSIMYISLIHST